MGRLFRNANTELASKLRISGISATSTSPRFGRESGDQVLDRNTRQLAQLIARQGFDETKRPGKESGADPRPQASLKGLAGESRTKKKTRQPGHTPTVPLGNEKPPSA